MFYKVVTKVALIFTLAASFWQSARQENIVPPVLSDLYLGGDSREYEKNRSPTSRTCGCKRGKFHILKVRNLLLRRKSECGNTAGRNETRGRERERHGARVPSLSPFRECTFASVSRIETPMSTSSRGTSLAHVVEAQIKLPFLAWKNE